MTGDDLLRAHRRSLVAGLSPKQRTFYDDPAKTKAALGGRRGGKTWVACVGLYEAARAHPRALVPYVGLSGVTARRILWPVLEELNASYRLGLQLYRHELVARLPENGSEIFLVGGDDARKVEALRGGKYPRAVIDEAGSFPRELLRYLVEEALEPALMDLDGDLWLLGTPNAGCVGYFHDVTTGSRAHEEDGPQRVATHHWTVLDNPHIPHAERWLTELRQRRGWTEQTPRYRREYLAHWVRDASSLVFRFDRARHLVQSIPAAAAGTIGVDLGASQEARSTAFVVNLWAKYSRTVYTRRASKHAAMSPLDGGDHLAKLVTEHPEVTTVLVDEGGLGKGYADEWRRRASSEWSGPARKFPGIKAAQKRDKLAYVEFLNAELDRGRLLILDSPDTRPLIEEIELLQWNEDRDDYDPRFEDHASDAWLYGWRECFAWSEDTAPASEPAAGSPEWLELERERRKDQAIRDAERRARKWRPGMTR